LNWATIKKASSSTIRLTLEIYTYAFALGFRGGVGSHSEKYAAELIEAGSDINSSRWQTYIEKLLKSKDQDLPSPKDGSE